jgi:Ca-activated chloride channel family protein
MRPFFALLVLLLAPMSAAAQGWIEPPILRWPLPRPSPAPHVERVRTSVIVRVTDRVARVEVQESFRNTGGGLAEGHYLYPLPGDAVFSNVSLFQGEEELKGETMDARTARAIYEDIVRRHRDPALIELAGHGLLRARVFPIGPGETRMMTLRYTQVLDRAGDALRFRYLAGAAGGAIAGRTVREAAGGDPRRSLGEGGPLSFTLVSEDAARFGEPFSPTHRLRVARDGGRLTVRAAEAPTGGLDIFLPLAGPEVGIALATHRAEGEDGYFMLTLSPGRTRGTPAPRDVAVVLDVSGSMSGEKMEQARQALHRLLDTLGPNDRFRLIAFSNRVDVQRRDWTAAARPAITEARAWVDRLEASGGTGVAAALDEAFRTPSQEGRLHLVIVITDGLPTIGETDPDRIAARAESARGDARVFTFGVGYDVHTYLLDRLAAAGRGTVDYVEPGRDVEEAVGSLAARITHPVLMNLRFAGSPVRLKDMQPTELPDLYAGQDLVVFGRYEPTEGRSAGELSIEGTRSGRVERFAARLEFPATAASSDYLPRLWAARRIGELMRTIRLEGQTPERVAEVRELALRHGLLSEYTSHLVQEPANGLRDARGLDRTVPTPAPQMATGQAAVASARLAATRREVRTAADVAAAESVAGGTIAERSDRRVVAGRTFRLEAGAWIDTVHAPQARVIAIEPFSRAYFDVLTALPELRPYVSAFESMTVAGGRASIRIAAGGRVTLEAGELAALVGQFRRMK